MKFLYIGGLLKHPSKVRHIIIMTKYTRISLVQVQVSYKSSFFCVKLMKMSLYMATCTATQ
jgi:hypothetical protein